MLHTQQGMCTTFPFFNQNNFFKNSFFPSTISEWIKLDPSLRSSESFLTFKNNILQFIRAAANSVYKCHNPKGIKLITRLRLGLSHLREHKFKHNFQESLNPLCNFGPLFTNERFHFNTDIPFWQFVCLLIQIQI